MDTNNVLFERAGTIGKITLNRPEAINALNHAMINEITNALRGWSTDNAVSAVVLTGAGERGLCAGADVITIYDDAVAGGTDTANFWRDEFRLNAFIATYPKPFVALMDGLVMGGGIGLSAHARYRIVTDKTKMAFPETGLGLVPDVGSTWLLANAPGELGIHAVLTGSRLTAGDALELGLADAYMESGNIDGFIEELTRIPAGSDISSSIESCISQFSGSAPASTLAGDRKWIDECYTGIPAEEILTRLLSAGESRAHDAARDISEKSPVCVKVALESIRRARSMTSLEKVLEQELRVSLRCFAAPDLTEGLRSQVIEKDRNPTWSPGSLSEVTPEHVREYFSTANDR